MINLQKLGRKINIKVKNIPKNLNIELYLDEDEDDLPQIAPLEGDEEQVKGEKGLKIFTPSKLLTRLPILFVQIKAGNNSNKLKNEIRKILYPLC